MCGITGWVHNPNDKLSKSNIQRLAALSGELLKTIEPRGTDSTGAYVENSDGVGNSIHRCYAASKLIESKAWEKWLEESFSKDTHLFLGHTRLATVGGITQLNAHPLITKNRNLIGIHNGGFSNYKDVEKKNDLYKYFSGQTDSIRMFANITKAVGDESDTEKTKAKIKEAIEEFSGSAALAFKMKHLPYLWLYKDGNPLNIFYDVKTRTLFFSSFYLQLQETLEKFGYTPSPRVLGTQEIYGWMSDKFDKDPMFLAPTVNAKLKSRYSGGYSGYNWNSDDDYGMNHGWSWTKDNRGAYWKRRTGFSQLGDCAVCGDMIDKRKDYFVVQDRDLPKTCRFCDICYSLVDEFLAHLDCTVRKVSKNSSIEVVSEHGKIKEAKCDLDANDESNYDSCQVAKEFSEHKIGCDCKSCNMQIQETAEQFAKVISEVNPLLIEEDLD